MKYEVDKDDAKFAYQSKIDVCIEQNKKQASKYYKTINECENAPKDVRDARKEQLKDAHRWLEHERRLLEAKTDVLAELAFYQERGREATKGARSEVAMKQQALLEEKHHQSRGATELEKYMRAVPIPKPSANHTAHHIVPGKGKTKDAVRARVRLHLYGIRINDPSNGVWLPKYAKHTPHWSMPDSLGHLQYHTENYETWVLKKVRAKSGEAPLREELKMIGKMLQENTLPQIARKK